MIKPISHKGKTFGYIIKYTRKLGVNFLTPKKLSHQVGFIKHKSKHLIKPHKHYKNVRRIEYTSEVLIILKGKLRVDFYSDDKIYFKSTELVKGDVILLAFGGHGIYMIEESEIIEVKQGPFSENMDKTKFEPMDESQVIL